MIFNHYAALFLGIVTYQVLTITKDDDSMMPQFTDTHNMCDKNEFAEFGFFYQLSFQRYMVLTLWILLAMSCIEGVLEWYFSWMPHQRFFAPMKKSPGNESRLSLIRSTVRNCFNCTSIGICGAKQQEKDQVGVEAFIDASITISMQGISNA